MSKQSKVKKYDEEPVIYCASCYSINIRHDRDINLDYCGECGCTNLKTTNIYNWEKLFKDRYKHKFIEEKCNIKKSPLFTMSLDKLKDLIYKDIYWKELCKSIYPSFPDGLGRTDSIILLFDKLIQDNKLDRLRIELINQHYKNK